VGGGAFRSITRRRFLVRGAGAGAGTLALLYGGGGRLRRLVEPDAEAAGGQWLAGDLHVHTCYSHDVLCPGDDNTGPEDFFAAGFNVGERFRQADDRGLDYLAIADHDEIRAVSDVGFGTSGVVGLPAYETSVKGHAQMLGARRIYDRGDRSAAAVSRMAEALRAAGGVFQANHPAYRIDEPPAECSRGACKDCAGLHWTYGFGVRPDTIEVWNAASPPNEVAEDYWECWLNRGERITATAGSDSHWASTNDLQGPGQPTTWIRAGARTPEALLEGLREGRTTLSAQPPARGGVRLMLEADPGGGGAFEASMGDTVAAGTPMRVRALGLSERGVVRVRGAAGQLLEAPIAPGEEVRFEAPASGWARATLFTTRSDPRTEGCGSEQGQAEIFNCRDGMLTLALTSPIYIAPAGRAGPPLALRLFAAPTAAASKLRGRGLRVGVQASRPASVTVTLLGRVRPRRGRGRATEIRLGRVRRRVEAERRTVLTVRLSRRARLALARRRLVSARLVAVASDGTDRVVRRRALRIRRPRRARRRRAR